jgi:hypothetical protein
MRVADRVSRRAAEPLARVVTRTPIPAHDLRDRQRDEPDVMFGG